MFWTATEWTGTTFGLIGAYLLANKNVNPINAWIAWVISDSIFISLFGIHTKQYGLLLMHSFGLIVCTLGAIQWSNLTDKKNIKIESFLFYLSLLFIVIATTFLFISTTKIIPTIKSFEWFGSCLSISGTLLMASKYKLSPLSWPIWMIGNSTILAVTLTQQQWGVSCLQFGFILLNIYGIYTWIYKNKNLNKGKTTI